MEIDATSPGGNGQAIMATVMACLRGAGRKDEWPAIRKEMMSGDYDNLCDVAERVTNGSVTVVNR